MLAGGRDAIGCVLHMKFFTHETRIRVIFIVPGQLGPPVRYFLHRFLDFDVKNIGRHRSTPSVEIGLRQLIGEGFRHSDVIRP